MIARLSPRGQRHDDMRQLVTYLFGPGRANEHIDPRVVAAADGIDPDVPPALLAAQLDGPRQLFGTVVKDGSVWHAALSNGPADRVLDDREWADAADVLTDRLGFRATRDRAQCRWIAVRHGTSARGNDHIHIAVSLVREDGTRADLWQDQITASRVCAELEARFGLSSVEGRRHGTGLPGYARAEAESASRRGRSEPERLTLARRVRAASVAAVDERDFEARLRRSGVDFRARTSADGGHRVGYSVALPRPDGTAAVWFGGGRLAADLTLPRLRSHWSHNGSPHNGSPGDGGAVPDARGADSAWHDAARLVATAAGELRAVDRGPGIGAEAARQLAGVLAAWSLRVEESPGALAGAADALVRTALAGAPGHPAEVCDLRRAARLVADSPLAGAGVSAAQADLARELAAALRLLADAERAQGRPVQAARLVQAAAEMEHAG